MAIRTRNVATAVNEPEQGNGENDLITNGQPYLVDVKIQGVADFLFHRWNCEEIELKAAAPKNSKMKKSDNLESYVYRDSRGYLSCPGEYLRQSIVNAAKSKADPRSPRKSAKELYQAGIIVTTQHASFGKKNWDYEDKRRVVVQRAGINRVRPAMQAGYELSFEVMVNHPEYISFNDLHEVVTNAGRFIGIGDFRPTFGRFNVVGFREKTLR